MSKLRTALKTQIRSFRMKHLEDSETHKKIVFERVKKCLRLASWNRPAVCRVFALFALDSGAKPYRASTRPPDGLWGPPTLLSNWYLRVKRPASI